MVEPDAAAAACAARGGIARSGALLAAGVTKRQIAAAERAGSLRRVIRGVLAVPETGRGLIEAIAHGGVPGCLSAAELHGLWVVEHRERHVWIGSGGHRPCDAACSCLSHWDEGEVRLGELPSIPRTLVQIARCDADSGLESIFRLRLRPHGLDVRFQVWRGNDTRSDFLIGDRLLLEVDGKANHDDRSHRHADLVRDAEAALWDLETLRFDYALVMHDWPLVESAILAKVAAGSHLSRRHRATADRPQRRMGF